MEGLNQEIAKYPGLVVVEMGAPWCPSCRRLAQLLPNIASEFGDVQFIKTDVDVSPEIRSHYGITSIPVTKWFKNVDGEVKELDTLQGCKPPEIKQKIAQYK